MMNTRCALDIYLFDTMNYNNKISEQLAIELSIEGCCSERDGSCREIRAKDF